MISISMATVVAARFDDCNIVGFWLVMLVAWKPISCGYVVEDNKNVSLVRRKHLDVDGVLFVLALWWSNTAFIKSSVRVVVMRLAAIAGDRITTR